MLQRKKITSPPNEWHNIPFHKKSIKTSKNSVLAFGSQLPKAG